LERGRFSNDGMIFKLLLSLEKLSYDRVGVKEFEVYLAHAKFGMLLIFKTQNVLISDGFLF
jgi:hypothetical protein